MNTKTTTMVTLNELFKEHYSDAIKYAIADGSTLLSRIGETPKQRKARLLKEKQKRKRIRHNKQFANKMDDLLK